VRSDWAAADFDTLDETHFTYFLALKPDVLLLGTGTQQRFPHPRLYRALTDACIGVEFMNTPAACRTYNILAAEGHSMEVAASAGVATVQNASNKERKKLFGKLNMQHLT